MGHASVREMTERRRRTSPPVLAGEEPVEQADGQLALVVGRDGNIDEAEGRVGVAEGNGRTVDIGRLPERLQVLSGLLNPEYLRISARIGDDQKARLLESLLDLIGEGTRSVAAGEVVSTGVLAKLEDSTLSVGTGRDDNDCKIRISYQNLRHDTTNRTS